MSNAWAIFSEITLEKLSDAIIGAVVVTLLSLYRTD